MLVAFGTPGKSCHSRYLYCIDKIGPVPRRLGTYTDKTKLAPLFWCKVLLISALGSCGCDLLDEQSIEPFWWLLLNIHLQKSHDSFDISGQHKGCFGCFVAFLSLI